MSASTAKCIYCGRFFNPKCGEGDHILSVRLFGLFKGDKTFRGVCTACNNVFGRLEQTVSQSSHLGYFRRLAWPKLGRPKRTGRLRQKGCKGSEPPKHVVQVNGRERLVQLCDENPRDCVPVDELVVVDDTGQEHHVRLFRGMSADDLRAKISKLGIAHGGEYRLSCSDDAWDEFVALSKTVLSPSRTEELPATKPGIHRVPGHGEFHCKKEDYCRALAKIAFHYYLVYNERGFRGNEPDFRNIRRFIRYGDGDPGQFFRSSGGTLVTPFGETMSGKIILPGQWCHVLAVLERDNAITVYLQLYLGPENNPKPDYITLAEISSPIILPNRAWGHVYPIERGRNDRYAGKVEKARLNRLR